jgi:SAM-dependent methyltransferase
MRFTQLLKLVDWREAPSLIDYGCGYGALAGQLIGEGRNFTYTGFDLAPSMVDAARSLIDDPRCRFTSSEGELDTADYTLASGIFNVRLETDEASWGEYVLGVIDAMAARSERGFAFNMLTRHADPPLMRPDLYYADPARYFSLCAERYSRAVALLHDYELYEFTILVRLGTPPKPLAA